jgi:hypothetical protein
MGLRLLDTYNSCPSMRGMGICCPGHSLVSITRRLFHGLVGLGSVSIPDLSELTYL